MSEYIPLEKVEILKRVPIKPLIQFRSVCKTWKCLIDSPDFIVSYGVPHPQPDRFILRYKQDFDSSHCTEEVYLSVVDHNTFAQHDFAPTIPHLIKKIESHSYVVGTCHGLLCLYGSIYEHPDAHGTEMVVLWNPSNRKSIGIQVPCVYVMGARLCVETAFGFGVCPVTVDPIILKISYDYTSSNGMTWQVEVFTLSSGTWEFLSTNLPRQSFRLRGDHQVIIGGFIYWVAFDDTIAAEDGEILTTYLIISFDLTAKEFKEVSLPDMLALDNQNLLISKLRESLVVLEYPTEVEGEEPAYSLWMMRMDQGVTTSFTRLYTIKLPYAVVNKVLGFRKTGEPIMETQELNNRYATLDVYEPCSHQIVNLGIEGEYGSFFMCSYMETLLLLDQPDGYIYSNSN